MKAWPTILAVLCLAACAEPPLKEIAAAEASLAEARKAGAGQFAPERLKEAEVALQTLREKVEAKDYRGALSAASDAADKAKEARRAAETAKALARSGAETAQGAALALLDEVKGVRRDAMEAKVPDRVFAALQPTVDAAHKSLDGVATAIDRGEYAQAEKTAVEVKTKIASLPRLFRDAMDKWQVTHGHRPPAKKP
jgi:hypothetical protein